MILIKAWRPTKESSVAHHSKTALSNPFATRHMWRMAVLMWRMALFPNISKLLRSEQKKGLGANLEFFNVNSHFFIRS